MGLTSRRSRGISIGSLLLLALLMLIVWEKTREIAKLRGLIGGARPVRGRRVSIQEFERLFEVVSQSQQGYRDLIDTFDDLLFLISSEETFRAANRSVVDLFGVPFSEIIGRRVEDFLEVAGGEVARQALAHFIERGHWSGILRVKLKRTGLVRQFDCVLRALKKDGEVVGAVGLARDIVHFRESEALFTELFETLREGVYFTTPDGRLLDANPALVRMLGYESKEELLGVNVHD